MHAVDPTASSCCSLQPGMPRKHHTLHALRRHTFDALQIRAQNHSPQSVCSLRGAVVPVRRMHALCLPAGEAQETSVGRAVHEICWIIQARLTRTAVHQALAPRPFARQRNSKVLQCSSQRPAMLLTSRAKRPILAKRPLHQTAGIMRHEGRVRTSHWSVFMIPCGGVSST